MAGDINSLNLLVANSLDPDTVSLISPLPAFTLKGTIGLPSICPYVCSSICPLISGTQDNSKSIQANLVM